MTFPEPVIEIAVEPKTKADQEKMSTGLARLLLKILHSVLKQISNLVKQ